MLCRGSYLIVNFCFVGKLKARSSYSLCIMIHRQTQKRAMVHSCLKHTTMLSVVQDLRRAKTPTAPEHTRRSEAFTFHCYSEVKSSKKKASLSVVVKLVSPLDKFSVTWYLFSPYEEVRGQRLLIACCVRSGSQALLPCPDYRGLLESVLQSSHVPGFNSIQFYLYCPKSPWKHGLYNLFSTSPSVL